MGYFHPVPQRGAPAALYPVRDHGPRQVPMFFRISNFAKKEMKIHSYGLNFTKIISQHDVHNSSVYNGILKFVPVSYTHLRAHET